MSPEANDPKRPNPTQKPEREPDIADEAGPKTTEFEKKSDADAMVEPEFEKVP